MQLSRSYQLIRKLAAGGMAEVFLARSEGPRGFSKTLVLKRILPHLVGDEHFVEMFLSEARLVAQLNHPNVVQIFDFGEFDDSYYITMEFIDGPTLRALIRKAAALGESLPLALCARIIASASEGLAYAHDFADPQTYQPLGLVHRDVSPDNIMIARTGTVKVVDFGIAKAVGQKDLTQVGMIKGKLSYMPPEQMRGRTLDRRVDVFALGMVLYELLTLRRPFDARGETEIMEAILHKPMKRLAEHRPDAPEALERIVQRCLAKDRQERYPSCRQLRGDLERYLMSTGEPVGAEELATLVGRLIPPEKAPTSAEPFKASFKSLAPKSLVKSPPPRALPQVTPPPIPKPHELAAVSHGITPRPRPPPPPPVELLEPPAAMSHRPLMLLVDRKDEPPAPAPTGEGVEVPTMQLNHRGLHGGRVLLLATVVGTVLATASAALLQQRTQPSGHEEAPSVLAPEPSFTALAPPQETPVSPPQPELPEAPAPAPAEPEPHAEPSGPRAEPAPAPLPPEAVAEEERGMAAVPPEAPAEPPPAEPPPSVPEERSEEPPQEQPEAPQKPVALAKRARPRASGGSTEPKPRQQAQEEPVPPPAEPAPQAPPKPPPAEPQLASAVFSCSPPAQIRVNGQFVGFSPVPLRNLTPGPIEVEVYDSVQGFSKRQTFYLEPGDNGQLHVPVKRGTLVLRIYPDAEVFLDGKRLGRTPLGPITLYEGQHGLRLENAELGKQLTTTLTIEPGEPHVFKFNLAESK